MTNITRRWRQWWLRLATGSALALTVTVPAVALADMAADQNATPSPYECPKACGEPQQPQAPGTTSGEDARQAAEQSYAQDRYQLGSGETGRQVPPEHPYSQAHYQLGAGHQD